MSTPIVPSDAPHAVKYDRPTETYRVLNAAGIIVDRYQHDSGDFSGRRAMYRLALEDAAVRDAAAARAEARAWADEQDAIAAAEQAADEAAPPRLLWSWAGNAAALRGLVSERRAAWMAQQQRWLLAADAAGLAATEHYEVA